MKTKTVSTAAEFLSFFAGHPVWAIITATRADSGSWDSPDNTAANLRLRARLTRQGFQFRKVAGVYKGVSDGPSYLVAQLGSNEVIPWLREFGQASALTNEGLKLMNGGLIPLNPAGDVVGAEAEERDSYTILPNGVALSLGLEAESELSSAT